MITIVLFILLVICLYLAFKYRLPIEHKRDLERRQLKLLKQYALVDFIYSMQLFQKATKKAEESFKAFSKELLRSRHG